MVELIWDERFRKTYKKWVRQHPELKAQFAKKIVLFEEDPFHPSLKDPHVERCPEVSGRSGLPASTASCSILSMKAGLRLF
jgi:hypothetical protein